jgi:hypothetical protein
MKLIAVGFLKQTQTMSHPVFNRISNGGGWGQYGGGLVNRGKERKGNRIKGSRTHSQGLLDLDNIGSVSAVHVEGDQTSVRR